MLLSNLSKERFFANLKKKIPQNEYLQLIEKGMWFNTFYFNQCLPIKLMQLGIVNQIVDDSDFKLANFDHRIWSDSDFNDQIKSTIAISIKFISNFGYNRSILIFFQLKLIDF